MAGEFLVIAATLILIKSRSLLPVLNAENPEEEEEIDSALSTRQLIRRLIEFRKFKELAQQLRALEDENRGVFYRANVVPILPGPEAETPSQDLRVLFDAFVRVLRDARVQPTHTVRRQQFHVEDKLAELRERIRGGKRVNLREIFARCICKEEIIVTFLASLEMAKMREITIAQAGPYDDILIGPWDDSVVYVG
jgi:segregation and condensation protein A